MTTRLDLPVLGDKEYAQLVAELTAAIPRYSDTWTDYNASDPGTTLLQLLAWLGDVTFYRIDALPIELYLNFAALLVGADEAALDPLIEALEANVLKTARGGVLYIAGVEVVLDPQRLALAQYLRDVRDGMRTDLATLRQRTLAFWNSPYRAVTPRDIELLTLQVTAGVPPGNPLYAIRRAVVRTVPPFIESVLITDYPVTYTITTKPATAPSPVLVTLTAGYPSGAVLTIAYAYSILIPAVVQYLEPRRLLGTPLRVRAPTYNPVELTVRLAPMLRADPTTVLRAAFDAVLAWLSPVTGGADGTGWPYGRPVRNDELFAVIAGIPGVDHSQPIRVEARTLPGFILGTAVLGSNTLIGPGYELGLPRLWSATIEARSDTWTFQLGVHARVGTDTVLQYAEA